MMRGPPLRNMSMHYSDEHRYVLAFCARRANELLWNRFERHVDPEELMAEGWWRCMRRLPPGELRQAIGHTILSMIRWAVSFYVLRGDCVRAKSFAELEDADVLALIPSSQADPSTSLENRDTVEFLKRQPIKPKLKRAGFATIIEGRTLKEVAKRERVSHERIRQRRNAFTKQCRKLLEAEYL